jgi:virginiamycin B lyase
MDQSRSGLLESERTTQTMRAKNFPLGLFLALFANATPTFPQDQPVARPGVKEVQVPMTALQPSATFDLGGSPDWLAISGDAVWVANSKFKAVQRIDPTTNKVVAKIEFPAEPCSGLTFAFGSLWVPLCGEPRTLARVDPATNKIIATLPVGPADDEGGITASDDAIWLVSGENGTLLRVDPSTNAVRQKISIPPGSFNPLFSGGMVWITGNKSSVLTPVNARTGEVLPSIKVGPQPRFLTSGGGSIWTLNQGDGSVTRVDVKTRRVTATIPAGIPGHGGEICYAAGSVWPTVFDLPLTLISPDSNTVLRQWIGPGGDAIHFGHGSLWLTHLRAGLLWRLPPPKP